MQFNKFAFVIACLFALALAVNGAGLVRNKRGLVEDADKIMKQNSGVDTNNVGQLADLVAKNGAEECLARVICELTQNPKSHGEAGNKFAQSLLKFRQSKHPKVKKYIDALTFGAKAKNGQECRTHFGQCTHPSQDIVQVGNKVFKN